jgi:hypothetical protein
MIVISSSIPKSGSTLVWCYQQDLIERAGRRSGQSQLSNHSYHGYIHSFNIKVIATLLYLNVRFGDIVVKTHASPTPLLKGLITLGFVKATFCYRDPRDIILSAIDHGERTRKGLDPSGAFQDFYTVEEAIPTVKNWLKDWYRWRQLPSVLFIRYESLMENKFTHLVELSKYLGLSLDNETLKSIVQKQEDLKNQGLAGNFNKGTVQRYQTEMSDTELKLCNEVFKKELVAMQYEDNTT